MFAKIAFVASIIVAAVAAEPVCGPGELVLLAGLASNKNIPPCEQNAGGFKMVPPSGYPTPEQNAKMCATPACHNLIKDIQALKPNDCILDFGTVKLNVKKLSDGFEDSCKTTTPTSVPTSAPTKAPTNAPPSGPTSAPTAGPTSAPSSGPSPPSPTVAPSPTQRQQC